MSNCFHCIFHYLLFSFFLEESDIEGPEEYCKKYNQQLNDPVHFNQNSDDSYETGGN